MNINSYNSLQEESKNIFNRQMKKNFSFSRNTNFFNNNKDNNINDIFNFINTGKISKSHVIFTSPSCSNKNINIDKNELILSKIKRNNSFYKNKSSSYSGFFSFDKKNDDNIFNNLFNGGKMYNKKMKYVYEHYNKVFNNKTNTGKDKNLYNIKNKKQDSIMKTIDKFKNNFLEYKKKSFIDNSSPTKSYQKTIRVNCVWNKENKNYNSIAQSENVRLTKRKNFSKSDIKNTLLNEINLLKKELNNEIVTDKNKSSIDHLISLCNSKKRKKNTIDSRLVNED